MPTTLYVVPQVLLVAVLLISAVAKLRDPRDTTSVFRQLELPAYLIRIRAPRLLPYGELVLAAALLLPTGRWYLLSASVTLALFVSYFVVVLRALRLPYPVTCPCFGRLGLGEVNRLTLVRNGVLVALAGVAWAGAWSDDGLAEHIGHTDALGFGLGALVVALVGLVVDVAKRHGRTSPPIDADPLDYQRRPVPPGVLHGPGGPVSVWELSDAEPRLLVFCDPELDREVVAAARGWAEQIAPVRVHLVHETDDDPAGDDLRDPDGAFRRALLTGSPGAVLVGTDRLLAGGPVEGFAEIDGLVEAMVVELGAADRQ